MVSSPAKGKIAPSSQRLKAEIWDKQLCSLCGSCQGLCPYLKANNGKVHQVDACNLESGRCYEFCPRTSLDMKAVNQAVFGRSFKPSEVGNVKEVATSRTTDREMKVRAQHGGTVTTLMAFALDKGLIDAAVMTKSKNVIPCGVIAWSKAEIATCGGSNFLPSPTLEAFNLAGKTEAQKIGFVGLPCQILALAKRRALKHEKDPSIGKLKLTIGLFCTWSLTCDLRDKLAGMAPLSSIRKMDVPSKAANAFQVFTDKGMKQVSLDEVRQYINPACSVCADMTSEYADISVGVARGMPDWNTVIIRSETGLKLFEQAKKAGVIETGTLAADSFENLKRASARKKEKALQAIKEGNLTFLHNA